jgi:hypothetical protein
VSVLADELTELQTLRLEAELIAAFGVEDAGRLLTNAVLPSGLGAKGRRNVVVPSGVKERLKVGLGLLKEAELQFAKANSDGITNSDTASVLGLRSDYGGGSNYYLSYSLLGILMREGKLSRDRVTKRHIARVQ